jgi:hypothetical protein
MKKIKIIFSVFILITFASAQAQQQEKDLGDKEYVIVKEYKPVLADAVKISEVPKGDTTTTNPPKLKYNPDPRKMETTYQAGVIKPVKIKDESLPKLKPFLIKLGIGNYSTYYGELFLNSLRSKDYQYGLHLNHISGNPTLKEVSAAGFGKSGAEVYGKYFLENSVVGATAGYDQQTLHYYGLNAGDTIVKASEIKQQLSHFSIGADWKNNKLTSSAFNYDVNLKFERLTDLFAVAENDFKLSAEGGKKIGDNYYGLLASYDYFKKTDADFEVLNIYSNMSRNILNLNPYMTLDKDKIHLKIGFDFALEKNVGTDGHFYPDVEIEVPIAEHVVSLYANVTGGLKKNTFRTMTQENEFTTSAVKPYRNTSEKAVVDGGIKGAFSNHVSFVLAGRYKMVDDMVFFYNDTIHPNKFNIVYDNGSVLNLHGELTYHHSQKLNLTGYLDLYTYKMDTIQKPYHKPDMEAGITGRYNLFENIYLNASLLIHGTQYERHFTDSSPPFGGPATSSSFVVRPIDGYVDLNAGVEYVYMKNLSFFANFNNMLMSKYERWYGYPSEKFNFLAGLTYSF